MESFQNIYPIFKPLGHVSIVSFDIALIFFYYRITGDICFFQLKLWVYGQSILHTWLAVVAFIHLVTRNPSPVYKGRILFLVLKVWWIFFAMFIFNQSTACMTSSPLLYWWVGCGGLILGISLVFEWKPPIQTNSELRAPPLPVLPVLPEISFGQNSTGKCEVCPICLELFNQDEIISVLSCNHLYHPACIYEWFRTNLCCPVCRTPVEPGE